jgi:hypothetical protein
MVVEKRGFVLEGEFGTELKHFGHIREVRSYIILAMIDEIESNNRFDEIHQVPEHSPINVS